MTHYEYSLINTFFTKIKYNFHHNNLQFSIDVTTLSQISIFAVKYFIFNEYVCMFISTQSYVCCYFEQIFEYQMV